MVSFSDSGESRKLFSFFFFFSNVIAVRVLESHQCRDATVNGVGAQGVVGNLLPSVPACHAHHSTFFLSTELRVPHRFASGRVSERSHLMSRCFSLLFRCLYTKLSFCFSFYFFFEVEMSIENNRPGAKLARALRNKSDGGGNNYEKTTLHATIVRRRRALRDETRVRKSRSTHTTKTIGSLYRNVSIIILIETFKQRPQQNY